MGKRGKQKGQRGRSEVPASAHHRPEPMENGECLMEDKEVLTSDKSQTNPACSCGSFPCRGKHSTLLTTHGLPGSSQRRATSLPWHQRLTHCYWTAHQTGLANSISLEPKKTELTTAEGTSRRLSTGSPRKAHLNFLTTIC